MNENNINPLVDRYIQSLKIRGFAERTLKETVRKLGKFVKYLENREITRIDGITKECVLTYQTGLHQTLNVKGRPNTAAYQNSMMCCVKQFTRFLYERDYLVSDPARNICYARQPKRLPRGILTPAEARKIIQAPDTSTAIGYRDRTILEVLYTTGIRKEELNSQCR